MQKEVDNKNNKLLSEMEAAQRQIGKQVSGLQATVQRNYRKSAEDTKQAMDRLRDEILGALVGDTADLIAALDLNENVRVVPTNASRYIFVQLCIRHINYHKLFLYNNYLIETKKPKLRPRFGPGTKKIPAERTQQEVHQNYWKHWKVV